MAEKSYKTFTGDQVTTDMLEKAATLFSENYGIWGEQSHKPGERVKLSASRLREQYLPPNAETSYTRVTIDGILAGNVFVCRWDYKGSRICWITQLVVHQNYRERGLAGGLLRSLRTDAVDDIYGIMSSHPAACLAAASSFATNIERVSLEFIREKADAIMRASPIPYVKEAKLCGTLFDSNDSPGLVSGVNTGFFVDHDEPLEALGLVRQEWAWPLGDLPDGHEFLLILTAKHRRSRSRSLSAGKPT